MQFSLSKPSLLKELNLLQGVVEKKNTIPILSNILIEASSESEISLVATDLDVSMQTSCGADVTRPGAIVLQARKLFDIVRNLPDAPISFSKEDNDWVKLNCGASEFKMVGQAKEHFPATPKSSQQGLKVEASVLHDLISRTIYAITQEESRYALNGSLFLLSEGLFQMISTDGHRLALAATKEKASDGDAQSLKVNIPKKALSELLKLTSGSEETVEFSEDGNHLFFRLGHRELTTRLLAGQFPNYELVIPKGNDKTVALNSEKVTQAIRRAAVMADERSHGVKFEISNNRLEITSQSTDVGEAQEAIPVDYTGDKLAIGFNAQYLLDFLNVVDTGEVALEFKDEQSPVLMRPVGDEKYDYKYVVMPMRLI